ncbi:DUF1361 domain-containing protein [Meridianimaribacter flavus]
MNTIKSLLFNRFKLILILTASLALSIVLLMIRAKITHSFFFLFLVWNLFLAIIPYGITTYLSSISKPKKLVFVFWFLVWLLFLPNAPYIVTDLLHLKISSNPMLWLDVLLVTSFAYNGLMLFFLSLSDMEKLLHQYINKKYISSILLLLFGLTAFGIYIGRFLRYNSWEIIHQPSAIFTDIFEIIFKPNIEAWAFTITFGSFLAISYWMLKVLKEKATVI